MFSFAVDCWAYQSNCWTNQGKSTLQAEEDASPDTDTNCSANTITEPCSDSGTYTIALSSSDIRSHPDTNRGTDTSANPCADKSHSLTHQCNGCAEQGDKGPNKSNSCADSPPLPCAHTYTDRAPDTYSHNNANSSPL
jgi:hypothetical protein